MSLELSAAPFGWCFIGAGRLGRDVAAQICRSGRHKIVSVYTRSPEGRGRLAQQYGAFAAGSAEEAICAPDVEGVYIVTPHTSHCEYTLLALSLGKPVLCEKPMAVTAEEARRMIAYAREQKLYLAEAMWTWFSPVAHKVKEWLDRGEYGRILRIVANYHLKSFNYAPRVTDPMLAGGALLDVGVYPLTYLYRLFGKPRTISCRGVLANGIDLGEEITLTFENGASYTVSVSLVDMKGFERFLIKGTEAKTDIWFPHGADRAVLRRRRGTKEVFTGDGSYLNEFDRAAEEIREGITESRLVPLQATLDVMEIMNECRRQMGLVYPFEEG